MTGRLVWITEEQRGDLAWLALYVIGAGHPIGQTGNDLAAAWDAAPNSAEAAEKALRYTVVASNMAAAVGARAVLAALGVPNPSE